MLFICGKTDILLSTNSDAEALCCCCYERIKLWPRSRHSNIRAFFADSTYINDLFCVAARSWIKIHVDTMHVQR